MKNRGRSYSRQEGYWQALWEALGQYKGIGSITCMHVVIGKLVLAFLTELPRKTSTRTWANLWQGKGRDAGKYSQNYTFRQRSYNCPREQLLSRGQGVSGMFPSVVSIQLLSCVWLFLTPWTAAHQASLFIINSWSLLKLMSIELLMPSNHLTFCLPLLLLPSIFPGIRAFSNESILHNNWPKYWSFSFSISPSNEYAGLISFRIDWFDLLAVWNVWKSSKRQESVKGTR